MNVHFPAPRLPPQNLAAEQALLGALLANNLAAYDRVSDVLRPEHFADPVHATIFEVIARHSEAGRVADVVTLRTEFEHGGRLSEVGGPRYLSELLGAMVGIINAAAYARQIRDCWHRRQLIGMGTDMVNAAYDQAEGTTAGELQEEHEAGLLSLVESSGATAAKDGQQVGSDVVQTMFAAIARKGGVVGVASGYAGLDRMLGGLRRKQFVVLGGRPAMGKTALVAGFTARAAHAGAKVYFWGGEMESAAVMARLVAAEARVPLAAITRGAIAEGGTLRPLQDGDPEVRAAVEASQRIGRLPIHWDDQPSLTIAALRSRLRRHKRRHGLDLVVVDYLGLLRGSAEVQKFGATAEVGEISKGLKAIAMELAVPVLACCQLNRGLEGRDIKRPTLADLRQSGEIEQDADVVMFVHREHYYLEKARPVKKPGQDEEKFHAVLQDWRQQVDECEFTGEIIVAKQRQGETGTVPLRWAPRMTWYFDSNEPDGAGALA